MAIRKVVEPKVQKDHAKTALLPVAPRSPYKGLAAILSSTSRVSEILSGKRKLTLPMIRALHEHLGIPAEVLIREAVVA